MRFTQDKVQAINERYDRARKSARVEDMGYALSDNCLHGTAIYKNGWHICDVQDIPKLIAELERISACILDETGVLLGE